MDKLKDGAMRLVRLAVDVREDELRALLWSFVYFFLLLSSYYVLRPIRDEMGITGGTRALPWLFTGTFITMLCCIPLFGWVVKHYARRTFIPIVYWFFVSNIVLFWALLESQIATVYVARAFFIWTSVFNLFVVSVFWSFMADIFSNPQGRRLFGFIAAGGTAGTIVGPVITIQLVTLVGPANLMLVSALLLCGAIVCVRKLGAAARDGRANAHRDDNSEVIGGGIFAGIVEAAKSPYLLGICFFMLLFTTTSTVLYFEQAEIVQAAFSSSAERTRVFASVDLAVSTLTILTQLLLTGRIVKRFGVTATLMVLPLVTLAGFTALALAPMITVLIAFQIVRRASDYAVSRPSREVLYTVIPREQKYKAKNFIDTVVYRGGDAASGWIYDGLARGLGFEVATIALLCIPVSLVWAGLAWGLGRAQDTRAGQQEAQAQPVRA
jgi:AAA family ATP:ADP antiporter